MNAAKYARHSTSSAISIGIKRPNVGPRANRRQAVSRRSIFSRSWRSSPSALMTPKADLRTRDDYRILISTGIVVRTYSRDAQVSAGGPPSNCVWPSTYRYRLVATARCFAWCCGVDAGGDLRCAHLAARRFVVPQHGSDSRAPRIAPDSHRRQRRVRATEPMPSCRAPSSRGADAPTPADYRPDQTRQILVDTTRVYGRVSTGLSTSTEP